MHLHGHKFFILGSGSGAFPYPSISDAASSSPTLINLKNPPYRDTTEVPAGGGLRSGLYTSTSSSPQLSRSLALKTHDTAAGCARHQSRSGSSPLANVCRTGIKQTTPEPGSCTATCSGMLSYVLFFLPPPLPPLDPHPHPPFFLFANAPPSQRCLIHFLILFLPAE
jgi:Multicopper oxidase